MRFIKHAIRLMVVVVLVCSVGTQAGATDRMADTGKCKTHTTYLMDSPALIPTVATVTNRNVWLRFTVAAFPRPPAPWRGMLSVALNGRTLMSFSAEAVRATVVALAFPRIPGDRYAIRVSMNSQTYFETCLDSTHRAITQWPRELF